jgi:hypothetical protein
VISPKPHRAANEEETDMANGNDMNTAQCYETPTFDPRGVFSWTLRAGEIARLEAQRRRNEPRDPKTSVSKPSGVAKVNHRETGTARSPRYETPTFDPRGVFSWTLRAGEIARRQRQPRPPDASQLDVRAAA